MSVRTFVLAVAALAIGCCLAGSSAASLVVGVNDDAAKDPALVGWFYPALGAEGLRVSAITLRWDDGSPTVIPDQATVNRAIAAAAANGQTVELDLFPLHSQVFTGAARCSPSSDPQACGNGALIQSFAAWTALVATAFPTVHQFIVMNECNQPLFVNPQWDTSGQNQSAEICGRALAASYDALKAVSTLNMVWGVGVSPRGNDNPNAASNSSTSPVSFLKALGTWFKAFVQATGRTRPLMDGLDFHPYPIPQSQPFAQGYQSVTEATVSNLPRIYQAFYDGFNGSPQPTIGQQAGGGLPLSLNEVGIQTDSTGKAGYVGSETSGNAAGGVIGQYATEDYQSTWYIQMLNLVACDPNVQIVDIYHLIDESSLAGWQSGLYYVDRTPKEAAATVHDWIASTGGNCQGVSHPWTPPGVSAATGSQPPLVASGPRIVVAAAGRIRIFDAATHVLRRVLAPFGVAYTGPISLALGDVNRDGVADIAVGEGPGGSPSVKVLNGKTGRTIASYTPFARAVAGGVAVALADVTGDGRADLVVGAGAGGAGAVKVYNSATGGLIETLSPFGAAFTGGVSVAAGDVNGDGKADVIVGSGSGGSSRVVVFDGSTFTVLESLVPFKASFTGGVSVAAGDVDGDGKADVIVATGAGAPAQVKIYRDATKARLTRPLGLFDAFAPTFTGGVSVAAADLDGDHRADVVVGAGGGGGSQVKAFSGVGGPLLGSFLGTTGSDSITVGAG